MNEEELNQRFVLIAESLEAMRSMIQENRSDIAHFAEWAETVTNAIQSLESSRQRHEQILNSLESSRQRHEQILNSLESSRQRHEQILNSLAASQEQQQAILLELIRQRNT